MPPVYLPSLTALRGIAALLVVVYHFSKIVLDDELLPRSQSAFVQKSYLMVDLFFILSGFIMAYVYGAHFREKCSWAALRQFFVARLARLYPLHLFTIGWYVMLKVLLDLSGTMPRLSSKLQQMFQWEALPVHLLFLNAFVPQYFMSFNVPSWSVSAEWYTYLLFPLLTWVLARRHWLWNVLLVLFLYGAYWGILQLSGHYQDLNVTMYGGFLRCLVGFGLGMILYALYVVLQRWNVPKQSRWLVLLGVLVFLGMHFGISDLWLVALFPVLILLAAYNNTGASARLLERPVFQRIGEQSYSIYMIHVPLMSTLLTLWLLFRGEKPIGVANASALAFSPAVAWGACCLYVLLVLGLAALTHRYVEMPMRVWVNGKLRR